MNVLFLCHRIPFPPTKGDKIRAFNILQALLKKHNVYLGTFVDEAEDRQYVSSVKALLQDRCKIVELPSWLIKLRMLKALAFGLPLSTAPFYSRSLQAWVDDLIKTGRVDRAVVFGTAMAPYLLKQDAMTKKHVIFDMVDIDSDKWRQFAGDSSGLMRLIFNRESKSLFRLEREGARHFGATLLVSPFERQTFADLAPDTHDSLAAAENGVDLHYFDPGVQYPSPFDPDQQPIVMTGRMDYRPNSEGARWFIEDVLPLVRQRQPAAHFYVVGAKPPASLRRFNSRDGVTVTGAVEDVRPYLSNAAVVVAPLHQARGVQNKVLEGMAMKKTVVATTPATRALHIVSGDQLFVADEAVDFASAVLESLAMGQTEEVAARARTYVERHHNWDNNLAIFDSLLKAQTVAPVIARKLGAVNRSAGPLQTWDLP